MEISIKQAGIHDIDNLMKWRMEVLKEVFQLDGEPSDELKQANLNYYQTDLINGNHLAVFAEADGENAGCGGVCFYQEMPSPDNLSGWCAYLMNIYTRKQYRGHGIGEKTICYLIKEIQKRGITKIYLETSEIARPLYEKLGFTDMDGYLILS